MNAADVHSRMFEFFNPPRRVLDLVFPDPRSAAEQMTRELPSGVWCRNAGVTAGPAYSQLVEGADDQQ